MEPWAPSATARRPLASPPLGAPPHKVKLRIEHWAEAAVRGALVARDAGRGTWRAAAHGVARDAGRGTGCGGRVHDGEEETAARCYAGWLPRLCRMAVLVWIGLSLERVSPSVWVYGIEREVGRERERERERARERAKEFAVSSVSLWLGPLFRFTVSVICW